PSAWANECAGTAATLCYGPVRGGQRRREDESLSTRAPERPGQGARNAEAGIWVGTSRNALYPTAFSDPAIRMVTRYSQASSGVCSQQLSRANRNVSRG